MALAVVLKGIVSVVWAGFVSVRVALRSERCLPADDLSGAVRAERRTRPAGHPRGCQTACWLVLTYLQTFESAPGTQEHARPFAHGLVLLHDSEQWPSSPPSAESSDSLL